MQRDNTYHYTGSRSALYKPFGGISADVLRILALLFMLLDHLWATIIPGGFWMTCVGRMTFPIFAFQLTEGFIYTSDRKRYALRLLIFALISEIPFNLIQGSSIFYPFHQNVIFTLLLGFVALLGVERAERGGIKQIATGILIVLLALLLSAVGFVDYGPLGILTVLIFYIFRRLPYTRLWELAAMILLNVVLFEGQTLPLTLAGHEFFFPVQGFAVFSMFFIWLYNGQKQIHSRAFQYGCYIFYPAHLLVLYFLFEALT